MKTKQTSKIIHAKSAKKAMMAKGNFKIHRVAKILKVEEKILHSYLKNSGVDIA